MQLLMLRQRNQAPSELTHWGRVTHVWRQAIIWTNAGLLLIGPFGTNFSEILIEILAFSFKKMRLKVSSAKRRPFCLGLNVLKVLHYTDTDLSLSTNFYVVN